MADHYDLTVSNSGWHQIEGLESSGRGGALAFAATLSQYSGASRTSPILRGNWISETLLGERLPKPPKDVPVLPETAPDGLTERELIEKHSSDQNCARCHEKIDPYGFALEAFDAIGRYRKNQNTQTVLPSGENITGLNGLQDYLVNHRSEDFLRQFAKKLLGYALGRSTQLSDRPLIEKIVNQLKSSRENSIEDAIVIIVQSQPFTHIRTVSTSRSFSTGYKPMIKHSFSRRSMLHGLGVTMALPWLESTKVWGDLNNSTQTLARPLSDLVLFFREMVFTRKNGGRKARGKECSWVESCNRCRRIVKK